MRIHEFLFETNVLNSDEIREQLKDLAKPIPEILQKPFIKAAYSAIINDTNNHEKITSLPSDSADWAKTAMSKGELVRAVISSGLRNTIERVLHWIIDLQKVSVSNPAPTDQVALADKAEAKKQLNSLGKMTLDQMLDQETAWFSRSSVANPLDFAGLEKKLDVQNNWAWWKLETNAAYVREGQVLQNCIGRIWTKEKTENEGQEIWILKDPTGESHIAMRCRGKELLEIKGINNRPPASYLINYCQPLFTQDGFTVNEMGKYDLNGAGYDYDSNKKKLLHLSEIYPFKQEIFVTSKKGLVEWTAPQHLWSRSFVGKYVAGNPNKNNLTRYDLVNINNRFHPDFSLAVSSNGQLVAVGNLKNPNFIIKPAGMENLKKLLNLCLQALKILPDSQLSGSRKGEFGLAIYGLSVEADKFTSDYELAQVCAVANSPKTILSMENPSEKLQISAVENEPELMPQLNEPSERVQLAAMKASKYPHKLVNEMVEHNINPAESVLLNAASRDGWSIEKIPDTSEAVQLTAIKHNPTAIAVISYWNAVNKKGPPSIKVQLEAVSQSIDALRMLANYGQHGGWTVDPTVQLAAVKNPNNQSEDFEEILDILGDDINPTVKAFITNKLRKNKQ